jgi:hypothetical protein
VGNFSYLQLFGGNTAASNYATPFGGSQGLDWDWSGPNSFSSAVQNPRTVDTSGVWGTYQLIVTEKRNGCKDTALKSISPLDFVVLSLGDTAVKAASAAGGPVSGLKITGLARTGAGAVRLIAKSDADYPVSVVSYSLSGQLLQKRNVQFMKGASTVEVPAAAVQTGSIQVIAVMVKGRVVYVQKVML